MATARPAVKWRWLIALVIALAGCSNESVPTADQQSIRDVLLRQFDKPEARLQVEPVIVAGDHAVAGWTQAQRGGRALLRKVGAEWRIVLCSGDALRDAAKLSEMGLSPQDAASIAERVVAAEREMDPDRVALFSKFDGVVEMDADGAHPTVGGNRHQHGTAHSNGAAEN